MLMLSGGLGDYSDCIARGGSSSMCAEVWGSSSTVATATTPKADPWWESLVSGLTQGVVKGIVSDGGATPTTTTTSMPMPMPAPAKPWYATTTGMIGIGVGALALFMFLKK